MFTTALVFLSFVVLNMGYTVGYNVYASLTTSNSNTMDTTTMEMMKRGNIAMGFNQWTQPSPDLNWTKYNNSTLGVSLEYPSSWNLKSSTNRSAVCEQLGTVNCQ